MNMVICKIEKTDRDYLAYVKSFCGKATYLLYFQDTITGAVTLHNFIEMLNASFNTRLTISIVDSALSIKNELILKLIKDC